MICSFARARTQMMAVFTAALTIAAIDPVAAQDSWPSRPIRMIISQPAGGTPDVICRLVANELSKALGQTVFVDNRGGGAGIIGTQAAARSEADGYTLLFGLAAPLTSHLFTYKSLPYDPQKDFTPISMVGESYFFILSHPNVPAKTLTDLIAIDKKDPGTLAMATDAPNSYAGLMARWLNYRAGTQFQIVPYSNMPQGVQDTVAGRVQVVVVGSGVAPTYIASRQLRPLAVSAPKRLKRFENVPTISETLPGVEFAGWFVILAPKGTPDPIVRRINGEMAKIMERPEMLKKLEELGFATNGAQTPETTAAFLARERERWRELSAAIGVTPE
jgi:tripartite-type tricarboxylate transporter receptor subunit TctC